MLASETIRTQRISKSRVGGNASVNAVKYKLTLPTSWVRQLGLDQGETAELVLDGETILIRQKAPQDLALFLQRAQAAGHKITRYDYYDGETLCAEILADRSAQQVAVKNHVPEPERTPFGVNASPTWEDFLSFLEDRCIPRTRTGIKQYLAALGLDEYDPQKLVAITQGRMAEDKQWLKIR
jgi:antitoxin component of MazEF toxin-antitoxin module